MTPPVITRWIAIIENGRTDDLEALLADDAVFFSPAVFTPQEGRDKTAMYLKAAAKVFGNSDFHYVERWYEERSAILEFAATIDGIYVNGIDMIHWNDDEQIVSFKVMLRPLKALQTIIPAMAELLQQLTTGGARLSEVHKIAAGMPYTKRIEGPKGNAIYQVGGKSFVFFRTPQPDAADADTGEWFADVIMIWVESESEKLALVQDPRSPFFTTGRFDDHPSVLVRGSRLADVSRTELAEL